ncbi:MAG: nitrous oxide reductase family maturation protein NosD [Magnetococcales bacterium]|nr:nitrous oxide reductase family maturation protein NosD [Magnetococcales bacterium]
MKSFAHYTPLWLLCFISVFSFVASGFSEIKKTDLQQLIDDTKTGGVLKVPAGTYQGPIIINRPITLDGGGKVIVDGGGKGTVVTIKSDNVTIKNFTLQHSGQLHNNVDACIQLKGDNGKIINNKMVECLFGIDIAESDNNLIEGNYISSYDLELGIRGDAMRLWYSKKNIVRKNTVRDSRDIVIWYSGDNIIEENDVTGGRYSIHFMYANGNIVRKNVFDGNAVGVFLMYTEHTLVEDNLIRNAAGATGLCLGMKDTSNVQIIGNRLIYCSSGIYLDQSPFQPDTINLFKNNEVAFNGTGVLFHMSLVGNQFFGNRFYGNFIPVSVDSRGHAQGSVWKGNYWDTYQGFDRNQDGIGDTPFKLFFHADKLWMDAPNLKFFFGSPVLEALDFLEKLAPFSDPELVMSDPTPLFTMPDKIEKQKPTQKNTQPSKTTITSNPKNSLDNG